MVSRYYWVQYRFFWSKVTFPPFQFVFGTQEFWNLFSAWNIVSLRHSLSLSAPSLEDVTVSRVQAWLYRSVPVATVIASTVSLGQVYRATTPMARSMRARDEVQIISR